MDASPRSCADGLLEVVPQIMRVLRAKVRSHRSPELSLPQFRALAFLGRNHAAMLGDVANFLALTLPAASKLIDGLVTVGYASREIDPSDRRKVVLTLTATGKRKYASALKYTAEFLSERLAQLNDDNRRQVIHALASLQTIFSDDSDEVRSVKNDDRPARNGTRKI